MAQINIRVADEEKKIFDNVVTTAGFSPTEYLNAIVSYTVEHRALPVVIKFQSTALNPDEIFQYAILLFRDAYISINDLCENVLKPGEMTPPEALRQPIDQITAAERFYDSNENAIAEAPGQKERVGHVMFARCREHFPYIPGFLRTAIRMVNMNNRPVNEQDLIEMRSALSSAATNINILQSMVNINVSADSYTVFFLRDAKEVLKCAQSATKVGEAYLVCCGWKHRMNIYIQQAETAFNRLGVVKNLAELEDVRSKLVNAGDAIFEYLDRKSEPMGGFDASITDELSKAIIKAERNYSHAVIIN